MNRTTSLRICCACLAEYSTCVGTYIRKCAEKSHEYYFPVYTYQEALAAASLTAIEGRRSAICINYIEKLKRPEHPVTFLLPRVEPIVSNYDLKSRSNFRSFFYGDQQRYRTQRSQQFIVFKY